MTLTQGIAWIRDIQENIVIINKNVGKGSGEGNLLRSIRAGQMKGFRQNDSDIFGVPDTGDGDRDALY
tara:strand:- start:180 stop:383 length:204 start_codon:yes stop_codon:yes gene_type:complete